MDWSNWKWQQKNAVTESKDLPKLFPNISPKLISKIKLVEHLLKFRITPYLASLVELDEKGNPIETDPVWKQIMPNVNLFEGTSSEMIKKFDDNWELSGEMITPMLHHKYKNRVVLRIQNNCLSYCMFCFEAKRTLDFTPNVPSFSSKLFSKSLDYIKNNNEIQEVILSGGEPLFMSNSNLEKILIGLREIKHIKVIRLHTRVLTHNPFRFDEELIKILDKYDVTCLNVHFTHPKEVTKEVKDAMLRLDNATTRTIVLAHIPLLKGINDNSDILLSLCMKLYELKIIPYYLLHAMPNTLGAKVFRTSVKKGVEIIREIKRHYSNPAIPEYIIVHKSSKHTVPVELEGTSEFQYKEGYIKFRNYKGKWCKYIE